MGDVQKGVLAMIATCVIWGLSPLFYKLIDHIEPMVVVSHRTIWSLVFFGLILLFQRKWREVIALLNNWRTALIVAMAAVFISANWILFILSIQIERAVEASLGYYIFPLVAVLFGMLAFGERLSRLKWVAVSLAAIAVGVLTLGFGAVPWVSLTLATTFGFYGLLKKRTRAGAIVSVTAEVLLLSPLALFWLWGVHTQGWSGLVARAGGVFGNDIRDVLLLISSGPVTALPLVLFSYASQRITMATVGLIQYLNPTLQFFCAVAVFGEVFTRTHAVSFALIWVALAIYSLEAFRQERALRRAEVKDVTLSKELT